MTTNPAFKTKSGGSVARPAVLHVASGFRPWVLNGLVSYAEDLMEGQAQRGSRVGYFFAGRQYPILRTPRLHRWDRASVAMYEWLNTPVVIGAHRGTPDPLGELDAPLVEEAYLRVLRDFVPAVVHVHDLGGMPSSIVELTKAQGIPIMMTLLDYHSVCPTIKLYDVDGNICLRRKPGEQCTRCCASAPLDNAEWRERTLAFEVNRFRRLLPRVDRAVSSPKMQHAAEAVVERIARSSRSTPRDTTPAASSAAPPEAYQRRRDVNIERLNTFDVLMPMSHRASDIYAQLGVEGHRLRPMELTLKHLELLKPTRRAGTSPLVRFAALNVAVSVQKGSRLLVAALRALSVAGLDGRYRMRVAGWVPTDIELELQKHPEVEFVGHYTSDDLERILDQVDVGIVPSVWEEVYGFVGPEFLAKGIPVIGNALGGIPEYVRDHETGWVNHDNSAAGLAALMAHVIRTPSEIATRSDFIAAARPTLVKPFARHVTEVDLVYAEVLRPEDQLASPSVRRAP